jgi:hypothetical protein
MEKKEKLTLIESIFVGICLAILVTIVKIVFFEARAPSENETPSFLVHVVGAIVGEKVDLEMEAGSTVLDALGRVSLMPQASYQNMSLDSPLKPNQTLVICRKDKLSIFIKGKDGGLFFMAPGSTYRDLYKIFQHKKLKRKKRKLFDGEVVDLF